MSCVSIEVFTNDGMPSTICDACRLTMEYCYGVKQMCKKADTNLRQFPLTGKWPEPLQPPKQPDLVKKAEEPKKQVILNSIPVVKIEEPESLATTSKQSNPVSQIKTTTRTPVKPKILNRDSVKILNKNVNLTPEPVLSSPIITRNESGQVEIVTEILDNSTTRVEEPDPVLTAEPVETNVFPCPNCERSFPLRQLLDIHMVNHSRQRSFACEACDKRFFSKYDLGKHMLIHTGEKPYQCVVCHKAFTRSTLLHRHEKIHTDQPKFLCVFCEKPFLSKDELEKHTERHRKNRPFPCKVCGKSFAFKQGLERHETIHAKEQPFPCQYCSQSFSTPSKLSRHLTAHAGERPFPCKLCPKSYLLSHHLTRHLRSHTQGSGSYKCYDCERTFVSRDDLIYHSAVHATQNLMCPLCKDQFESLDQVTEHIKQHAEGEQYACEFCDLIFLTAERLQSHSEERHVDDMAAYEEHDKRNEKRMDSYSMADDGQQGDEVIQEFIIEEYHEGDEVIKEEKDIHIEEQMEEKPIILNKQVAVGRRSKDNISPQKHSPMKTSDEQEGGDHMEIEALEQKDTDDELGEEEQDDSDEDYQPPVKTMKVLRNISPRTKAIAEKPRQTAKESGETSLFKVPKEKKQLVQQTLISVLEQLPKSVTVMKKEKPTVTPTKEKRATPSNEVRILNEKIIRKADQNTSTKTIKLTDIKLPVKVIEGKSSSLSPKENIPMKSKPSPTAGPSRSISSTRVETKPVTKQAGSTPQSKASPEQTGQKKLLEMMIDNRKVKVHKIVMTKAEVAAMAKEGKIEMKGGTMILKQNGKSLAGKVVSKPSGAGGSK